MYMLKRSGVFFHAKNHVLPTMSADDASENKLWKDGNDISRMPVVMAVETWILRLAAVRAASRFYMAGRI